ncbi:MAG TPA: type II secretion system secretin GspD [Oligoflexia bacterium]|nr:type II secretion system secretin GspD [Oligoflexia bacterium]HMP27065.1 type II secretion system secretin GspD [Oligoflexia bacterium]
MFLNFQILARSKILLSILILAGALIFASSLTYAQSSPEEQGEAIDNIEEEIAKDASTEINVRNADIAAIVRIFSKKTKRNYILDESVKGKVTIYLPGKVSSDEAIKILDSVLALKGFTSVPIGENLWKIIPSKDAKSSTIPTITDDKEGSNKGTSSSAAIVTRLINLKYVSAEDIQQIVAPMVSADGLVNAYTATNSLLIIDSEDNTTRVANIINSLDVPSTDRDLTIIPIKNADAQDIADKLNEILAPSSAKNQGGDQATGSLSDIKAGQSGSQVSRSSTALSKTVTAKAREPKIIADQRTNSIVVVADEETTAKIKALVAQLDSEVDNSTNRFYVYRCQHAKADDLANILSGIAGNGGGAGGGAGRNQGFGGSSFTRPQTGGLGGGGANILGTSTLSRGSRNSALGRAGGGQLGGGIGGGAGGARFGRTSAFGDGADGGAGGAGRQVSSFTLGDNIAIAADPATNSLIINSSKADYEKILDLLKKIDVKRRQVLVEATLLEVGIEDSQNTGFEFLVSGGGKDGGLLGMNNLDNLTRLLSNPGQIQGFSMAAASAGTLTLPGGIQLPTQTALITAAQSNSNVNVLSAPNILTTDNEPASIVVGRNVPFLASQATSDQNLNNTFNQVDRQDVGIKLRITPQISSDDYVTLNIFTEVSDLSRAAVDAALGPTTDVRTSETTVIAKDSQMIVIGGLMGDRSDTSDRGVPFLKDIPVLGHIFRTSQESFRRTNLLIFILPRIVRDQFDAREATIDKRDFVDTEIQGRGVYPDRHEILFNEKIDDIAEAHMYDGPKPSSVFVPSKGSSPNKPLKTRSLDFSGNSGTIEIDLSQTDNQEITRENLNQRDSKKTVQPQAREQKQQNSPTAWQKQSANGSWLEELEPTKKTSTEKETTFANSLVAVLQLDQKSAIPKGLPFAVNPKKKIFAAILPEGSNPSALSFFQAGSSYNYQIGNQRLKMKVVGVFPSTGQALALYPEIRGNAYTLSPSEIMALGEGPWYSSGK